MKTATTLNDLKNTACWHLNTHLEPAQAGKKVRAKKGERYSKEKTWIDHRLSQAVKETRLILQREREFHKGRKWAFDWCFVDQIENPTIKIAFEYEGIFSKKSRHTTATGFTGDTDKYNVAMMDGWELHRYTALNYLDLNIDLIMIIEKIKKA